MARESDVVVEAEKKEFSTELFRGYNIRLTVRAINLSLGGGAEFTSGHVLSHVIII